MIIDAESASCPGALMTGAPLFRAARGNNFYVIFENFARNKGEDLPLWLLSRSRSGEGLVA
jgi:hypothetical protein